MSTTTDNLLAEVVACLRIVEDYTKRLDDACAEYYETGKRLFPHLSRAEAEDTDQHCKRVLTRLVPFIPDAMTRWNGIKYPIDQYEEQIERSRDFWIRRRNLLRVLEQTLRTTRELDESAELGGAAETPIVVPDPPQRTRSRMRVWLEYQRAAHGTLWTVVMAVLTLLLALLALFV